MASNTIDNDRTMSESEGTLLANRYRIVRQLGQGGMGSVWLAEDTLLDNKQFAIKMLPSILVSNKRAYNQLKSEALVAMKLSHPNIVTLRAFEENNGNPFLVMDYIDGQTLDDYLAEKGNGEWGTGNGEREAGNGRDASTTRPLGGLPEDEVVRILKPIAAALDYAHSKGVVHRDVKPGNVMVAKDGTPYVLDFGISREMQETMTRVTGKLSSGTLLYMSPEQLHGAPPKKEQDIYSFAAMAYECMSGHPPFCRGQIEFQIDNDMPEPLVGRDDPIAPQSIANSIMSGLAKKPEDRPASCAGVLAVDDVGRAEHVERVEPGVTRLSRPQGSHAFAKAFGILALLAVIAGGAYYGWLRYGEGLKEKTAEIERIRQEAQKKLEDERKANEARIAKLRAEKVSIEAENRRILEERGKQEKKPVEELARIDEPNRETELTSDGVGVSGNTQYDKSDAGENGNSQDVATRARREYKPYTGPTKEYIVKAGDTLGGIAYSNGLSIRQFKDLNGLNGDVLRVGQKLKIPIAPVKTNDFAWTQSGRDTEKSVSRRSAEETKNVLSHGEPRWFTLPGGVEMEMVYVAPGSFRMGSDAGHPDEKPVHDVRITKGYWIGKYPVTQAQWAALVSANHVSFAGGNPTAWFSRGGGGSECVSGKDTMDFPMERISWVDCDTLVRALNRNAADGRTYFIPTEAQWEFAARGGNKSRGYKYSGGDNMDDVGWYYENSGTKRLSDSKWGFEAIETNKCRTHSVREKGVGNELGIVGMSGNVWEWCQDRYDNNYYSKSPTDDPCNTASGDSRVLRGGSWNYLAGHCRSAYRCGSNPGLRRYDCGFRLCCSVVSTSHCGQPDGSSGMSDATQTYTKYVIRSGDTLAIICMRYKVRRADVLRLNPDIDPNKIFVGRTIRLPGIVDVDNKSNKAERIVPIASADGRDPRSGDDVHAELVEEGQNRPVVAMSADKPAPAATGVAPTNGAWRILTLPGGARMEMIYVAPGSFVMGSPASEDGRESDETQHRVTLTKGYWLGKYEVTQKQWQSVMGYNLSNWKGDNLPVENVSWDDCQEFIRKVDVETRRQLGGGARLPTEAEWEYACRAGTTTAYSWGNALNGDKANCDGDNPCGTTTKGPCRLRTAPVGSYPANPWGFYDMHGNVWEWCSDGYGNYSGNATDPIGSASGDYRVLRGGSWGYYARSCRSAYRYRVYPGYRDYYYGFRLCCSAGPRE